MWGVYVDWDRNYDFTDSGDNIWADVVEMTWQLGMGKPYQLVNLLNKGKLA